MDQWTHLQTQPFLILLAVRRVLLFAHFEVLAKGIQGNKIESIGGAKAAKACCRSPNGPMLFKLRPIFRIFRLSLGPAGTGERNAFGKGPLRPCDRELRLPGARGPPLA